MTSTTSLLSTRISPMSGVFTAPASCSTHWTYERQSENSVTGGLLLQNARAGAGDKACLPPGFDGWGRAPLFAQVFSPGACPSGYTTAGNNYNGGTTTAVCCKSNFGYTAFLSSVNAGDITAQYLGCTSIYTDADVTTVYAADQEHGILRSSMDGTTGIFTAVSGLVTMWAQPITVAFQKNDLSLFTTFESSSSSITSLATTRTTSATMGTSSSLTSEASTTTSPVPTFLSTTSTRDSSTTSNPTSPLPNPTSTPSSNQQQNSPSMPSTAAIAGIAVGAVAVLALIIGMLLLFRRKRRTVPSSDHVKLHDYHTHSTDFPKAGKSEYAQEDFSWDLSSQKMPAELQQDGFAELPHRSSRRHELP